MSLERAPLEHDPDATSPWFAPLTMFITWLAHLFEQIAKLKRVRRTTRFKPNWRDHWPKLRQCEWMRDQILAAGAAQLLAGQPLDLRDFIPSTEPPASYGGPCPTTPFEMNRRVLAFARWHADPEPGIRAHAERIARRESIDLDSPLRFAAQATSPALSAEEEATALFSSSNAQHWGRLLVASSRRAGGGSRSSRGPPLNLPQNQTQSASTLSV